MQTVAGILMLISGVIFPLAMVPWLNMRLGRQPALRPNQVGLVLALNGVLPVALITSGLALMSPRFWASEALRVVMLAAWLAAVTVLVGLFVMQVLARRQMAQRGDERISQERGSHGR